MDFSIFLNEMYPGYILLFEVDSAEDLICLTSSLPELALKWEK